MTEPTEIELTPEDAASRVAAELSLAGEALQEGSVNTALDGYVLALGLALQLGPASTGQAVSSILQAARVLASQQNAPGLSALGPALAGLVSQMREAEAVPATSIMEAWAGFVEGLGALIGQIGLALALPSDHRGGMIANARSHALLLDDATAGCYSLTKWLDQVAQ
jgi:hypothetical protein